MKKRFSIPATPLICLMLLSGCGYNIEFFPDNSGIKNRHNVQIPKPDLETPYENELREDETGPDITNKELETSRIVTPPLAPPTPEQRLKNLETSVQDMQNTLDALAPAILKLSSYSSDDIPVRKSNGTPIQLSPQPSEAEQDRYIGEPIHATPSEAKERYKPKPEVVAAQPAPTQSTTGLDVKRVRFGEYPTKTRIVIDVSKAPKYSKDLDNNERVLIVELPNTAWKTSAQKTLGAGSAIKSYSTQALSDGGTRVIFALAQASNITYEKILPPNAQYPAYRLAFDITK